MPDNLTRLSPFSVIANVFPGESGVMSGLAALALSLGGASAAPPSPPSAGSEEGKP